MVCDGVDLKRVTLCLSRQPRGRGSGEGEWGEAEASSRLRSYPRSRAQ